MPNGWAPNISPWVANLPDSRWRDHLSFCWYAKGGGVSARLFAQDLASRTVSNHSTSTGEWVSTQYGRAWRGNASNEKLRFPNLNKKAWNFNGVERLSIFICMKLLSTATAGSHMLSHQWGSGTGAWTCNWSTATSFRFFWHDGTTSRSVTWTNGMPAVNTFATFLLTRIKGGVHTLYLNGKNLGTQTSNFAHGTGNYDLVIGNETGANNCTHGDYYSVLIWRHRTLDDVDARWLNADPCAPLRTGFNPLFLGAAAPPGGLSIPVADHHYHRLRAA